MNISDVRPATAGEGTQNILCASLFLAILVGLGANALFGLWWADPAVALIVAVSALVNRDWEVAHRLELTLLTSGFAVPCAIIWYLLHLGGIARSVRSMNTDG